MVALDRLKDTWFSKSSFALLRLRGQSSEHNGEGKEKKLAKMKWQLHVGNLRQRTTFAA